MKKRGIVVISILILVGLATFLINKQEKIISNVKQLNKNDAINEIVESATYGLVLNADGLKKDSKDEEDMKNNTKHLQKLIDEVSEKGGGTVIIPAGTFYFRPSGKVIGNNGDYKSEYIIKCKNNVLVEGNGTNEITGTILKPYAKDNCVSVDMFYYNEYDDTNGVNAIFLKNADFRNFVIDSNETNIKDTNKYNARGKGFFLNLFENCDWDNVVVKNTDGTGFGMDCPINSTIKNCTAINCGKAATEDLGGASGFGIGTGYCNEESIHISNCTSIGNKKFGFFFEHQVRFNPGLYNAEKSESLVVSNCSASGNLYDFGGIRANDVTFENCVSYKNEENDRTVFPIYFEEFSVRTHIVNCETDIQFKDLVDGEFYIEAVDWAVNNSITTGVGKDLFEPYTKATRAQALTMLWRMAERPGDVENKNTNWDLVEKGWIYDGNYPKYSDVNLNTGCIEAAIWAKKNGIESGVSEDEDNFYPGDNCIKSDFITMLWKYSVLMNDGNKPEVTVKHSFTDIPSGADYEEAVNWAVSKGIIDGKANTEFYPNNECTRGEIVTFLYRYANTNVRYNITYNLNAGVEETNPRTYISGTDIIELKSPVKEGDTFLGWTGSNGKIPEKEVKITADTTGNLTYTANWVQNIEYIVEHYKQNIDGTYPETATDRILIDSQMGETVSPEVKTYEGFTAPQEKTIKLTQEGQIIRYDYERNTYKINIINGGNAGLKEPEKTECKYEEEVLLKLELKKGYQNLNIDRSTVEYQWSDIENIVFTMPAADVEFEISSSIITYLITYNLNDGSHSGNPSTYTVEDTMTLNQPTKEGYIFLGWTGSNGTTPQKEVTIEKGTTGNLEYTANWRLQVVNYTVNHYLQEIDGTYPTSPNYTDTKQGKIGTEVKGTVNNYDGFTSPIEKQITIKQNANENIIEYQYARNSYNVEITKGEGIEQISGNGTYKYEEEVTLSAEAKRGYGNIRWTGDKASNKFYMPSNNVQISVSASLIEYEIKYNLNGGNIEGNQSNPSKYTIETEEFTLKNPTRVGYTFIGWTGSNGTTPQKEVIIPKGTIGNLEYTANWEVIPTDEPDDLEIEISYSTKELTNKDVTVIISANNKIEAIEGWILSEDGKSISKVYRENATETVTIIDEYDNQEKQTIEIDNIDKISPEITIKYEQEDNYVTVTATSNEELKEIDGWEISENKKEMKKLYYVNQKEEVSFFDLAGNETKKPIEIDSIKNNDDDDDESDEGNPNNPDGDDKGTIDSTGGDLSDPTTSSKELPAAGMQFIIGTGFAIIIVIGIISFVKVKKYKDIK